MFQHAAWGRRRAAPFRTMCARLNGHEDYSTLGKPCAIDDCTVHGKNCGGNAPDDGPAGTEGRPGGAPPASTGNRRVSTRVDENRRRDEPATALTAPVSAEGPAGGGAPEVRSQSSRNAETGPGACGATRRREGHTKTRRRAAEPAQRTRRVRGRAGSGRPALSGLNRRHTRTVVLSRAWTGPTGPTGRRRILGNLEVPARRPQDLACASKCTWECRSGGTQS